MSKHKDERAPDQATGLAMESDLIDEIIDAAHDSLLSFPQCKAKIAALLRERLGEHRPSLVAGPVEEGVYIDPDDTLPAPPARTEEK